jgi:hypothetical protein
MSALRFESWRLLIGVGCCLLMLGSNSIAQEQQTDVLETFPTGQVNWTAGVVQGYGWARLTTRGTPTLPQRLSVYAQATQAARQRLLETIAELRYDATQTVGSWLQHAVACQQRLEALVAEAEVVQTRYLAQGTIESTVQLPLFGAFTSLLLAELSTSAPGDDTASDDVYTGVVFDARGLAIHMALFPRIMDEHAQPVYDPTLVDSDIVGRRGYIAYAPTFADAQAKFRIGEHPLVIRAWRVAGAARVDLMVRQSDAIQFRHHDGLRHLLRQGRVLILL